MQTSGSEFPISRWNLAEVIRPPAPVLPPDADIQLAHRRTSTLLVPRTDPATGSSRTIAEKSIADPVCPRLNRGFSATVRAVQDDGSVLLVLTGYPISILAGRANADAAPVVRPSDRGAGVRPCELTGAARTAWLQPPPETPGEA